MNVSPLQPRVHAADTPVERLAANANLTDEEKIAEASRQFEAALLRQILTEARKTVIPSQHGAHRAGDDIYQDMINCQLADGISRGGGLGLADGLKSQLGQQLHARSHTA
jgi:Rod binding domain-containing protein